MRVPKVFYPSGQEFFPKARILNKYEFALLYRFSALLGHEVKLYTALWINRSVVLGFIQCFPQAKSQLCFGFLALIPFFHRSTTSSAERIYCYYPIGGYQNALYL